MILPNRQKSRSISQMSQRRAACQSPGMHFTVWEGREGAPPSWQKWSLIQTICVQNQKLQEKDYVLFWKDVECDMIVLDGEEDWCEALQYQNKMRPSQSFRIILKEGRSIPLVP